MSLLARDAQAFKKSLARQDFTSWHSNPSPAPAAPEVSVPAAASGSSSGDVNKKKKKNVVYSQPQDTGSGVDINTQLVYAIDHLKKEGNPMRLQDLAMYTMTPLDTNAVLFERFRAHDRVIHDPKTNLYSYKHDFSFRTKATLLTEIQRTTKRGSGLSVRLLRESWREAPQAIEELEAEGEVYVTRTTKDQQMRMVFWNELKPNTTDEPGHGVQVEQEFRDLWHSLKVPPDADLLKSLASEGLQATNAETIIPKGPLVKKKGKRSGPRQRPTRMTNVHLKGELDLSKDYSPSTSK